MHPTRTLQARSLLAAWLGLWLTAGTAQTATQPTPAGPPDWEGQIIYQVMPDRFFDGDLSNDADVNKQDLRAWHGGDLAGLSQKLTYIRDLGATALWLTPIYRQKDGLTGGTAGYHGYWPYDFRAVDPHFGTLPTFKALTGTAHGLGLRVMLDQVINHYGYDAPALLQHPTWFHNQADCEQATGSAKDTDCALSGLPDLNQTVPEVAQMLQGNADFWRAQGVDAFRYDAVKHVDQDFLEALVARDRAAGTFTLGEYFGADSGLITRYQRLGLSSLFDFALQDALKGGIMAGRGLGGVRTVLQQDAGTPHPGLIGLFLDNHDLPRFASGTLFEDEGQARSAYALRALMTLKGIPVIWQGSEIAMRGGADPDNRRDMRFPDAWTPAEKAVYDSTRDAIAVRKASPALSRGDLHLLNVPDPLSSDLLLFSRSAGRQTVLVAWNNGKDRKTYSLKSELSTRTLTQSLFKEPGGTPQKATMSVKGGYLHLSLPGKAAAVFELK
ncbi:alpha-amylase family glycosyl hydrolase [Deinococcus sp.]|uniref:alpha-amylase family glycosyl hydrolase n=1 Tax=Deinococcus sp. TaxID=47478 RepID=UPI003CC58C43